MKIIFSILVTIFVFTGPVLAAPETIKIDGIEHRFCPQDGTDTEELICKVYATGYIQGNSYAVFKALHESIYNPFELPEGSFRLRHGKEIGDSWFGYCVDWDSPKTRPQLMSDMAEWMKNNSSRERRIPTFEVNSALAEKYPCKPKPE